MVANLIHWSVSTSRWKRAHLESENEFLFTWFILFNIFAQGNQRERIQALLSSGLYNRRFHQIGYVLNLCNVEGITTDKELKTVVHNDG